mmetsp:Transcript_26783/g.71280  ORF Transcript_26783/g.71280 Transcript_26783/m.71280 type:complete len:83 (+) Transcript_26783:275-523(+)
MRSVIFNSAIAEDGMPSKLLLSWSSALMAQLDIKITNAHPTMKRNTSDSTRWPTRTNADTLVENTERSTIKAKNIMVAKALN